MFDIEIETRDTAIILIVRGRLDSYGASLLDQAITRLPSEENHVIVDMSHLNYISSSGIRSLLKLEKGLQSRSGRIILLSIPSFVKQILEISGLLPHIRHTQILEDALRIVKEERLYEKGVTEHLINKNQYGVKYFPDSDSLLEVWGSFEPLSKGTLSQDNLVALNLSDLGYAFGVGGIGNDASQALESLGEFVSTGNSMGIIPADGHYISDFVVSEDPSKSVVYAIAAISLSGRPLLIVDKKDDVPITIDSLIKDLISINKKYSHDIPPPILGFIVYAKAQKIIGSYYDKPKGQFSLCATSKKEVEADAVIVIGLVTHNSATPQDCDPSITHFLETAGKNIFNNDQIFHGHGIILNAFSPIGDIKSPTEHLQTICTLDNLGEVLHIEPATILSSPKVWIYTPKAILPGIEKLLTIEIEDKEKIPKEWEIIIRRLYSDVDKVILSSLHGGFSAKTYKIISYDKDGRRMLPTVLKIGPIEIIRREEIAYQKYVKKYILNNSTTIMGTTTCGEFAGLRYNFLGINGPESKITWLTEHYKKRPIKELVPIFQQLFTNILKPWYGQPHWEKIYPYREHNPLKMFPNILVDAEKELGISPEENNIFCSELDTQLPNPYYFLKYHYPQLQSYSCLWYKGISHGDLNMQNILLDERENIYIIDFSETAIKNIVSDFARLEPILKIEMTHLEDDTNLRQLLIFEQGLAQALSMDESPQFTYPGNDPMVEKAYHIICLLRDYARRAIIFETDILPYLLAILEWTYPIVSFTGLSLIRKKYSAYSAGIICQKILDLGRF